MADFFSLTLVWLVLFGLVAGILMCGDPDKDNVCGRANFCLQVTLPDCLHASFMRVGGGPVLNLLQKVREFFCWRPNPIVQVLYLVLVIGGFGLFIKEGYPHIPNAYAAAWHKYVGLVAMGTCLAMFYLATTTDAGVINKETEAEFDVYPFDGLLYDADRYCDSCDGVRKPARSKHCRVCDVCVSRFDHHCIWLNRCVGERNYKWFLLFLIVHGATLLYGAVHVVLILASEIVDKGLLTATFVHRGTGQKMGASWGVIAQYLLFHFGTLVGLLIMTVVMGVVLVGFWGYHMWLVRAGTTTNESFKWGGAWHEYHRIMGRWSRLKREKDAAKAEARRQAKGDDSDAALKGLGLSVSKDGIDLTTLPDRPPRQPINVYNLGLVENLKEVWWPRSLRRGAWRVDTGTVAAAAAAAASAVGASGGGGGGAGKGGKGKGKGGGGAGKAGAAAGAGTATGTDGLVRANPPPDYKRRAKQLAEEKRAVDAANAESERLMKIGAAANGADKDKAKGKAKGKAGGKGNAGGEGGARQRKGAAPAGGVGVGGDGSAAEAAGGGAAGADKAGKSE